MEVLDPGGHSIAVAGKARWGEGTMGLGQLCLDECKWLMAAYRLLHPFLPPFSVPRGCEVITKSAARACWLPIPTQP